MAKLQFARHERVTLKGNSDFSETWLHERIKDDPGILGLGELTVIQSEKVQHAGGRLDILLADTENGIRFETEVMLGPTDPSHIIRCIEYWDIERRRYPAYDHVAVLIAEDVTARFLNVMSLLSGSIPLVAIQLNALQVGDQILLDFVKVPDQRELRVDDTAEAVEEEVDRGTWEAEVGAVNMQICDRVLQIANEKADPSLEVKYKKRHIGLCEHGSFFNVLVLFPKKNYVPIRMILSSAEQSIARATEAGLDVELKKGNRVLFRLRANDLQQHELLLRELIQQCVGEQQS